jgi:C1A family cysteine protease
MALALSPLGRRYGYHKDVPDHRDYGISATVLESATTSNASNLPLLGPVLDQGQEGSCTAHAAAADREFLHWKEIASRRQSVTPASEGMYSPSFIYYLERQTDGTLDQGDCGSFGRTSCSVLRKYGCALRTDMPYVAGDVSTAPTAEQLAAATKWATGQYHRLVTVDDMKSCIASGYCFRIGFTVYESFESIGADGLWTPSKSENVLGGHEVLAIGYDDDINGGSFEVRNSWGAAWGDQGNFYLRYADAADPDILMDAWIQHLGIWK